jgi:hypothetical protein
MNVERMKFDNIVTTENMRKYLGYQIPENKIYLEEEEQT